MPRAAIRNPVLALAGTILYLAVVIPFDLGCTSPGEDDNAPVVSVVITPISSSVQVGRTVQLNAKALKAGGVEVTRPITWHTTSNLISVSGSGLVTGVAEGNAEVTAISEGVSGTAYVTVSRVPVASVTVTGNATVKRNYHTPLTAIVKDAQGTVLFDRQVTWVSNNVPVATVDGNGRVSGELEGTATITASSEGINGFLLVTVQPNPVVSITVSPAATSVNIAEQKTLTATLFDALGNPLSGRHLTWISADPTKVTVSASVLTNGVVTGVAQGGPVTITAASEGATGIAQVTVVPVAGGAILSGRVINYVTRAGLAGASVEFQVNSITRGTATTASDGSFQSPPLPGPSTDVWILARLTGYALGSVFLTNMPAGTTTHTGVIPLVPNATPGGISGTVRDARTGLAIPSASVSLYSWANPTAMGTTAGSNGLYSYSNLAAGTYQLSATAAGYKVSTRTGVSVGNGSVTSGQDLVLSPAGSNDIRIVLTWGASPDDLDSHLTGPNADGSRFHVYYATRGNFTSAPFAGLDVDDINGNGPETITITQLGSGNYRYSVHDFSNRNSSSSSALGNSGASVTLYLPDGRVLPYFVPTQAGTLWTVFEMSGSLLNPVIVDRQQMSFTTDPAGILSPPIAGPTSETDLELIRRAMGLYPKGPGRRY